MNVALLSDRGIVRVSGPDARSFLNGLLTVDVAAMTTGAARFAALLTPQGKIVADMIVIDVSAQEPAFLLECPRPLAPTLVTKLGFYRLRAKVTIEDLSESLAVLAAWGEGGFGDVEAVARYIDPRLDALGRRLVVANVSFSDTVTAFGTDLAEESAYEDHRIALGVPRGGVDFGYGDTFPHEADMDQLAGIDFKKGCYVGQEVVSRMQHRGTARNRVVQVTLAGPAPVPGTPVTAGDVGIGTLGSSASHGRALAMMRLDRIGEALAAGRALEAGGVALVPVKPGWATFTWPSEARATG